MSSSLIDVLNPKAATNTNPPEIEDTYQDINSDEFDEHSDYEHEAGEAPPNPALEKLADEMHAVFSEDDIDEMYTYLKEAGMLAWIRLYVIEKKTPLLILLAALGSHIPLNINKEPHTDPALLQRLLKVTLSRILRRRQKLHDVNTPDDVVTLIQRSKKIIVLTGAGISVSCGIPDFRSSSGIYAQINENNNYELEDPQQMFDIDYFREKPSVFYSFARQAGHLTMWRKLDQFETVEYTLRTSYLLLVTDSSSYLKTKTSFCEIIPKTSILSRLKWESPESSSAMDHSLPLHVSNAKPGLMRDTRQTPEQAQEERRLESSTKDEDDDLDIPTPPLPKGIMKPDIVFFGEPLTDDFDHYLFEDRESVDLLLVIGTSLKVAPVSEILTHVPHSVPQILINKTPVTHVSPDVVLLGDADRVVEYLCDRLGWTLPPASASSTKSLEKMNCPPESKIKPTKAYNHEHVWMFPGADGGNWALRTPPPATKSTPPLRSNGSGAYARKHSSGELSPAPPDRHDSDRSIKKSRLQ
ncbi:NAD-dependent histone deacetylase SIR2 [Ceratobasidium sp. AG-Ba]|nr:NAD-dependent histone deacetylase SIR2 [Ceratobasidium sp. AG-Ba]